MPDTATLTRKVEQSLRAGTRVIQYRDKSSDHDKRLEQAHTLLKVCHAHDALLLINDDVKLAQAVGADGVHLGQSDSKLLDARACLGQKAIIGITCHDSIELALDAYKNGANYVAFGAFFASKTKPNARPAPLSLLARAKEKIPLPIVAIGGISMDNAAQVITAGANMVAVINALYDQPNIHATAQQFNTLFNKDSER